MNQNNKDPKKGLMLKIMALFLVVGIGSTAIGSTLLKVNAGSFSSTSALQSASSLMAAQGIQDAQLLSAETTAPTDEVLSAEEEQQKINDLIEQSQDKVVTADKAPVADKEDPEQDVTQDSPNVDMGDLNGSNSSGGSSSDNDQPATSQYVYGIDVSKYQGNIDWAKVKASGVEFVMIRVGYRGYSTGVIKEDPYAAKNLAGATAAGLKVGVYFYSTAINEQEAIDEANWVCNYISKYNITYPVAFDCEQYNNPEYRTYPLTKAQRTNCAIAFLTYVKTKGYTPVMYESASHLNNDANWLTSQIASKFQIWVAQYPSSYTPGDKTWYTYTSYCMWQYSQSGTVPGISGNVDMNISYMEKPSGDSSSGSSLGGSSSSGRDTQQGDTFVVNGITFTSTNQMVEITDPDTALNIQSAPSTSGTKLDTGYTGSKFTCTGISDTWLQIKYNVQIAYMIRQYTSLE